MPTSSAWLPWKMGAQAGSLVPKGLLRVSATAPPSVHPEEEASQMSPLASMDAVDRSHSQASLCGGKGGGWGRVRASG